MLFTIGSLSCVAGAKTLQPLMQLECPKESLNLGLNITGDDEVIAQEMKYRFSDELDDVIRSVSVKVFDDSVLINMGHGEVLYKKIDKDKYEVEEEKEWFDTESLGDTCLDMNVVATLSVTNSPSRYNLKLEVAGDLSTDKKGNYKIRIDYEWDNCKIVKESKSDGKVHSV